MTGQTAPAPTPAARGASLNAAALRRLFRDRPLIPLIGLLIALVVVLQLVQPGIVTAEWIGVTVREEIINAVQRLVYVDIEDNGRGLPEENRDRLTEPYVTTRAKGTGLGLAIVKKIMEDHNGDLSIEDRNRGGARVSLVFKEARARLESRNAATVVEVELQPSYAAELHANG